MFVLFLPFFTLYSHVPEENIFNDEKLLLNYGNSFFAFIKKNNYENTHNQRNNSKTKIY